jgi:hypothetical protein
MKVKDEAGQVWDITLAPGARVERSGLKEDRGQDRAGDVERQDVQRLPGSQVDIVHPIRK